MIENVKKNRMWLVTAIETLILGCLFILTSNFVDDIPHPHIGPALRVTDSAPLGIVLVAVGTFCLAVCLWDMHRFKARRIMVFLLFFVWMLYCIVFTIHDIVGPNRMPAVITIFAYGVMLHLILEAKWGDRDW